jgi:hypothetical protein
VTEPDEVPPPPERPTGPQSEAVAQAQQDEINLAMPALTAFVNAVMAYARTGGRIAGLPITVAAKVGYDAAVISLLVAIAHRALGQQRSFSGSRAAEELWLGQDAGVQAGVDAGLTTLSQAARYIARNARLDEASGGSPGVSLPGELYDPTAADHAKSYADPEQIALPLIQSTRHGAQLAAATEAGWKRKTWVDMHDNRVRVNHAFLGAKNYEYHTVPILEPFVTLDDNKLFYPGDTSAPPHEWMRCRCWLKLSR